ncbi:Helix-turn-helix domain-containing protein [Paenibacillus sp. UNCCL117]|nr:Helix-turn-helix domain-containing protein [Paenibacillus sp. cl123]SFW40816.1 Helix-turn-helix domain-containing protein [Paenibacillus sp. UNCCL117]
MKAEDLQKIIMGTEQAAEMWGLSQDHIKKLCRQGKCVAVQIGKTWVIAKGQENPKSRRGE